MKKFTLEIKSPCSENFDRMAPNPEGSFCNSCAKNVIDLSSKTNSEVARFISENKGKNICARLRTNQLEEEFELSETSKITNLKYAVAVAATVLLSSNVVAQEKTPIKTEINCPKPNPGTTMGKMIATPKDQTVSFVLKGKLLNSSTKKPLSEKEYPDYMVYFVNSGNKVTLNKKTGEFSVLLNLNKKALKITLTIQINKMYLRKEIEIDVNTIQNGILTKDIPLNPEEFENYEILGGLGIHYIDTKKPNRLT